MKISLNVDVRHVSRVEGHGDIKIRIENGEVREAAWTVVETPRYFEAMLRGKHYTAAGILTARICGICSIGHCLASVRASEQAFGTVVPQTAEKLRLIAKHGETLQSHVLHLFFLAAPDFFNLPSALHLMEKEQKAYDLARRLKALAVKLSGNPMTIKLGSGRLQETVTVSGLQNEMENTLLYLAETAAPDLIGLPNIKTFMQRKPEIVQIAARLKSLANRICDAVAGRTTHPVSLQVGGMAVAPDKKKLAGLRDELKGSIADLNRTAELFKTFTIPVFSRETEFVSLKGETDYPFFGGTVMSSDGVEKGAQDYRALTNEFVDARNTSKWCRLSRPSFAVGALARCNNNFALLHPEAQRLAEALGLKPICHNPFMNNIAQLVEIVHVTLDTIRLIDELLDAALDELMGPVTPRAGEGVGAVEVPRGILYHHYEYDNEGRIVRANCIIPTTQNNLNIHLDMQALARQFATEGMTDKQLELLSSMLVRAYDPCISCSVH